jgi:TonB family protein
MKFDTGYFLTVFSAGLCTFAVHAVALSFISEPVNLKVAKAAKGDSGMATSIRLSARLSSPNESRLSLAPQAAPDTSTVAATVDQTQLQPQQAVVKPVAPEVSKPKQASKQKQPKAVKQNEQPKPAPSVKTASTQTVSSEKHNLTQDALANSTTIQSNTRATEVPVNAENTVARKAGSQQDVDTKHQFTTALLQLLAKHKHYPFKARLRKEQGVVHVNFQLSAQGELSALSIKKTSGFARLDEAALKMFRAAFPLPKELQSYIQLVGNDFTLPIAFNLSQFND